MTAPALKISVIVVCRNPGPSLMDTLESVWNQERTLADLVVIDGASIDGTQSRLERVRTRIAHWSSAPDTGVYQAMNRGLAAARGAWLLFLGADDVLASRSVLADATQLLQTCTSGLGVGEVMYRDGRTYALSHKITPVRRNFLHHQGCFYRRSLFASGGYDESLRTQADYDLNLRLWRGGVRPEALALRVAVCGTGGLSDAGAWRNYREEISVRHRHFPVRRCLLWDLGSVVRCVRKKLVRRIARHG